MTRLPTRITAAAAAILTAAALAACDPADPAPPTPAPPTTSSPATTEPTPTPTPTPTLSQKEQDYLDAETAVRQSNTIIDTTLMAPTKNKTFPNELKKYVDPDSPYWLDQSLILTEYREVGKRFSAKTTVASIAPLGSYNPNQLVMYVCTDFGDGKIYDKDDKVVQDGGITEVHLIVRKDKQGWRVWDYQPLDDNGRIARSVEHCKENPT